MSERLNRLNANMPALPLDASKLDAVISVKESGAIATVRDLIADPNRTKDDVRALFGIAAATSGDPVRPINQLDRAALKVVAREMLKVSNPTRRVVNGRNDYSHEELFGELERETPMGQALIRGVSRLNGLFMENAITSGSVRPEMAPSDNVQLPDFDF